MIISGSTTANRIEIAKDVAANITLEGTNVLTSGFSCAGLQKNGRPSGTLTISGTGSLTAAGGYCPCTGGRLRACTGKSGQ